MRNRSRLFVLVLALAVSGFAQKQWANKEEYDLYDRISMETEVIQQIVLLREWESRYPDTDFKQERNLLLVAGYRKLGKSHDAFTLATQLLDIDPFDAAALYLMVTVAPTLENPSAEQITATENAAKKLLIPRPRAKDVPAPAETQATTGPASGRAPDPEARLVDELIREMRKGARVADPEKELRDIAEAALEWVRRVRR
jgi:hypothetical protein